MKNLYLKEKLDQVKSSVSEKPLRAVGLATQKGACSWLTVLPIRDMNFDLNKSEFRDAVKLSTTGKFLICPLFVFAGSNSMWITL